MHHLILHLCVAFIYTLTDFLTLPQYICFNTLNTNSQKFLTTIIEMYEPTFYEKAVIQLLWQKAMQKELDVFAGNQTWELIKFP